MLGSNNYAYCLFFIVRFYYFYTNMKKYTLKILI